PGHGCHQRATRDPVVRPPHQLNRSTRGVPGSRSGASSTNRRIMKKEVRKTGDFGIGQMIHVIHMSDDVQKLNKFYEEAFGGWCYLGGDEPNWLPVEDRWASLYMVGNVCIETMAPNFPVDETKPVGKFYSRFGQHLHSVGYKVDDLAGL